MTEILGNICSPYCFIWTIIYNPINLELPPIRENSKHVHWLGLYNLENMLSFLCKILMSFSKPWRYCWYITLSILDPPPSLGQLAFKCWFLWNRAKTKDMTRTNEHSKQLWHYYSMGIVKGRSKTWNTRIYFRNIVKTPTKIKLTTI